MKHKNKKSLVILTLLSFALVLAGIVYYRSLQNNSPRAADGATTQQAGENGQVVTLAPATKTEKQEAEDRKQEIVNKQNNQSTASNFRTVTPIITYAGQSQSRVEVNAYVPGVVENGGACKTTFSRDGQTQSVTTIGVANSDSTSCPAAYLDTSALGTGNWSLTVAYSSSTASGTSSNKEISVE